MLLTKVRETDRATSPFAILENTLDELPPGQHATSITPMSIVVGSETNRSIQKAMTGSMTSCPNKPMATARGCFKTIRKSFHSSDSPRSNISKVRIGITIRILFIEKNFCKGTKINRCGKHSRPTFSLILEIFYYRCDKPIVQYRNL